MAKTTVLFSFATGPSADTRGVVYVRAVATFVTGNRVVLPGPGPVILDKNGKGQASLDAGYIWEFYVSVPDFESGPIYKYVQASSTPLQYANLVQVLAPPPIASDMPDWVAAVAGSLAESAKNATDAASSAALANAAAQAAAAVGNTQDSIIASRLRDSGSLSFQALQDAIAGLGDGTNMDAIVTAALNPESELYAAILTVAGTIVPSGFPVLFNAPSLSSPRPATQPGQAVWWTIESDDPNAEPINVGDLDRVFVVSPDALPWTPDQDGHTQAWFNPRSIAVADGQPVTSWLDETDNANNLTTWALSSTTATQQPTLDADGMAGTPGVIMSTSGTARAGMTRNQAISPTVALVLGLNVKFGDATTVQTAITSTNTAPGRYSFGRQDTNYFVTLADAATTYTFKGPGGANADALPHSVIIVHTDTKVQVWMDGQLVLDQVHAVAMLATSAFRIGYQQSGTSNTSWRLLLGVAGDYFVATGELPDADQIAVRTQFLLRERTP